MSTNSVLKINSLDLITDTVNLNAVNIHGLIAQKDFVQPIQHKNLNSKICLFCNTTFWILQRSRM